MNFTELDVWKSCMDLVVDVYRGTNALPDDERFGLRSQIRRSAVSIASNVAEGEGRTSRKDHMRFCINARGSLYELQTQILICERLGYLEQSAVRKLIASVDRVGCLISGTMRFLSRAAKRESRAAI